MIVYEEEVIAIFGNDTAFGAETSRCIELDGGGDGATANGLALLMLVAPDWLLSIILVGWTLLSIVKVRCNAG